MSHSTPSVRAIWLAAWLMASALIPSSAHGQSQATKKSPRAQAHPVTVPPVVDGKLNDAAWVGASTHGDFVERKPKLRARPESRTRFRAVFDNAALYIAVWADDQQPDGIRSKTLARDDFAMFGDDVISLKIDPTQDRRTTIGFALNPAGAKIDYRGIDEREFRIEFDTVWSGAARRTNDGWQAEFRIPYAALGIHPRRRPAAMGFNITRDHARRNGSYDWSLLAPPMTPVAASQYGTLEGLDQRLPTDNDKHAVDDESILRNLSLTPYAIGGFRREKGDAPTDPTEDEAVFSGGIDAVGQIGSFSNHVTINTDFAQVDLDNQIVNFSRFGLFLPEKRDFFLRDLEVFSFGQPGRAQLLYSRRIGLYDGQTIPIMGGVKTVGRPNERVRVGLLHVTTRKAGPLPWSTHTAARSVVELGGGSNVGVMVTHRGSLDDHEDHNVAFGMDGAWRGQRLPLVVKTTAFGTITGANVLDADSGMGADANGANAGTLAPGGHVEVRFRDELVYPMLSYSYLHPSLRTDLGFLERVGVHRAQAGIEIRPLIGRAGLRRFILRHGAEVVASTENDKISDWFGFADMALVWDAGYRIGVNASRGALEVDESFEVGRDTEIAPGDYAVRSLSIYGNTPNTYSVIASGSLSAAAFYGGRLEGAALNLEWAPAPIMRLRLRSDFRHITFDDSQRDFNSLTLNSRLTFGLTTALSINSYVGYNLLTDLVRVQNRLRWTFARASDLFVVQQVDLDDDTGQPDNASFLVKSSYHWH